MASITQTSEGTWRVHIRKRGYASVSKTFKRKSEAQRWISLTEANMVTGEHIEVTKLSVQGLSGSFLMNICNSCQRTLKILCSNESKLMHCVIHATL